MRVIFILLITTITIVIAYSQVNYTNKKSYFTEYGTAEKLFLQAEKLSLQKNYNEVLEEKLNADALTIFKTIIPIVNKDKNDSLAFFCYYKAALLFHYFDSIPQAKQHYLSAIATKANTPYLQDSFLFQPLIFTARIFYSENKYDSAFIYYKKAEKIRERYTTTLKNEERLYNGLGAMYFETGNFKQAKNYFENALQLLKPAEPAFKDFYITYKINIASCLVKLEKFKEADSIYSSLASYKITTNEVYQSIGFVNLKMGNAAKAVSFFREINYQNKSNVLLYNQYGLAFMNLQKKDSAEKYYSLALFENEKWNAKRKNTQHGITYQYLGEKCVEEREFDKAIVYFQNAIQQFYPKYTDSNIYKNPTVYSGIFSYINLFNALTAKADIFNEQYKKDKRKILLEAALNTYKSAFLLSNYVEKTYDSDEARMFLNNIKYTVHDKPIDISLQLYEQTNDISFLESAYNFDQQNKASILNYNIQENLLKNKLNGRNELFLKEISLKNLITRQVLKAGQINDSLTLEKINNEIRENEISLGKIQDKIKALPEYKTKRAENTIPSFAKLQQDLDKHTAIISFHLSDKFLTTFCITKNEINYTKRAIDSSFINNIYAFKNTLTNFDNSQNNRFYSKELFKTTIKPLLRNNIANSKKLIIIPDDEMNNIPFEALQDEDEHFLVEKYTVQYQYSTAFLTTDNGKKIPYNKVLALAPFTIKGNEAYAKLSYSKNEIENLQGKILEDSAATKKNFLAFAEKSSILHLATHTFVNDSLPEKSFIAFYPTAEISSIENNLYLQEIYNLKLDSTKLVVLSACETGSGKLTKGEGKMSLARAFTYAGCPNIISSLWKADDKSTSWIMQRFYKYYNDDIDAATALQKAKLDYITSPEIENRFKSPNYWAHLVLTGVPEYNSDYKKMWWVIGIFSMGILFSFIFIKKMGSKNTAQRDLKKRENQQSLSTNFSN
jgi:CHAT domain-containing protein/tetratricopeptide (TPR) repeat protein